MSHGMRPVISDNICFKIEIDHINSAQPAFGAPISMAVTDEMREFTADKGASGNPSPWADPPGSLATFPRPVPQYLGYLLSALNKTC